MHSLKIQDKKNTMIFENEDIHVKVEKHSQNRGYVSWKHPESSRFSPSFRGSLRGSMNF